jgi:hypothetical protein
VETYLLNWMHAFISHFGIWVTLIAAATIYKDGAPKMKKIVPMIKSVLVLAGILSLFSSHSQTHLLSHFLK